MRKDPKRHRRFFVGQTGEYFVLFRLSDEKLLACLAPPGSPNVDILVSDPSNHLVATIQVKTRAKGRDGGWCIKENNMKITSDFHFFVFVDLEDRRDGMPASYVVPSKVVADVMKRSLSHDPTVIKYIDDRLFDDKPLPAKKFDMLWLLPVLRNPPSELTKDWMNDIFRDNYYIINKPLFNWV